MKDITIVSETSWSNPDTLIDSNTDIVMIKVTKQTLEEWLRRMDLVKNIVLSKENELSAMIYKENSAAYCRYTMELEETWHSKSLNKDAGIKAPEEYTWCLLVMDEVSSAELNYGRIGMGEMLVNAKSIQWSASLKHSDIVVNSPVLEEIDIRNILDFLI